MPINAILNTYETLATYKMGCVVKNTTQIIVTEKYLNTTQILKQICKQTYVVDNHHV